MLMCCSIFAAVACIISALADLDIEPDDKTLMVHSENCVGTVKSSSHLSRQFGTLDVAMFAFTAAGFDCSFHKTSKIRI